MRRDVAVVAVIALSAGLAAACGLTADFSGLQGGIRDGGGVDVGRPDTSTVDGSAPLEAATGDDGVAPTDGGAAKDAGFCASLTKPVQFCDDFDEGQSIDAGWILDVSTGQSATVDLTYYTPPGSFLSQLSSSAPDNGYYSARLQEDLPPDTPHVHVEFEMLVAPYSGSFNFELCTLHQPVADGTTYGIFYKYQDGNLLLYVKTLQEDGGVTNFTKTFSPPSAGWMNVAIDYDLSTSGGVTVSHDGAVVLSETNLDTLTPNRASMYVELGYYSSDPVDTLAHFDDVIVDWQ